MIGFVTTGSYSFVRGQGFAVGFCSAKLVEKLFKGSQKFCRGPHGFALLRNTASQFYLPVAISVVNK